MKVKKKDIRSLTKEDLRDFFVDRGEKAFRGNQVYEWLWKKSAHGFEDMTNLSKANRELLSDEFSINHIRVDDMQRSKDGTIKNAIRLHDGLLVESVLIPTGGPTRRSRAAGRIRLTAQTELRVPRADLVTMGKMGAAAR
jgi:23S rRNA (adenine2503-C2)-methyltransferase